MSWTKLPLPLLFCAAVAAGCSTTSADRQVADPEMEQKTVDRAGMDKKRRDFHKVLIDLDKAMDSYVVALANRGQPRADQDAEKIETLLRDSVLDSGFTETKQGRRVSGGAPGENFDRIKALATNASNPAQQGIALAALGFSGRPEVMGTIVQGAMSEDPEVVDKAVLGLAILRAPDTPPGVLAAIAENQKHPRDGRVQAAWALYRIQTRMIDTTDVVTVWKRWVHETERVPEAAIVQAVRGLGLAADDSNAEIVVPLLRHPTPRIRMAAALALGRMNAQEHWAELLALLEPSETVQNVRLHARKALMALAGNKDYGYDVAAWQKQFDRGQ
ncbi:MAG: HEAT repeat domain-containing protein [Planctomycetota bacterium]